METIAQRLEQVLHGRSPWKWGKSVLLNDGAISRILNENKLPDPVRLVPAMRIENLSLDWLLDGRGKPHPVAAPMNDAQAARWIAEHMQGDPDAEILIVSSADTFTPVLHSKVQVQPTVGQGYNYRATTIIGSALQSLDIVERVRGFARPTIAVNKGSRVAAIEVSDQIRHRLAAGELGNHELFGDDLQSGLYGDAVPDIGNPELRAYSKANQVNFAGVMDPAQWMDNQQRELNTIYKTLDDRDRAAAIRMLRGLKLTPN